MYRVRGALPFILVAGLTALLLVIGNAVASAGLGEVTEFPLPTAQAQPQGIALGPDGNLWFAERTGNKVGRVTPGGQFAEFDVPGSNPHPFWIAAGTDGAMWFTERLAGRIGRISADGALTEFDVPHDHALPSGIALGPDGAMWFTEQGGNAIGRITPAGDVTEFPVPTSNSGPVHIAAGPDGAMWFTEANTNKVGRIARDGEVTEFRVAEGSNRSLAGIALGPDDNLWFAERIGNAIGRITPAGDVTEFPLPAGANPVGVAAGPDDAVWFTESGTNRVGQVTLDGEVSDTPLPSGGSPAGIAAGPDGGMWYTASSGNLVGRVQVELDDQDATSPTIAIHNPADGSVFLLDQVVAASYSCADEPDGSGLATCEGPVPDGVAIDTYSLGGHNFTVTAADVAGNPAELTHSYLVVGALTGSLSPVPAMNEVNAGSAAPVGFDLGRPTAKRGGGARAVGLADGYPASRQVDCADPSDHIGPSEPADVQVNPSSSGHVNFVWKTDRAWAGTCRHLLLALTDPGWSGSRAIFLVHFA